MVFSLHCTEQSSATSSSGILRYAEDIVAIATSWRQVGVLIEKGHPFHFFGVAAALQISRTVSKLML